MEIRRCRTALLLTVLALSMLFVAASVSWADSTVRLYQPAGAYYGNGGEFDVRIMSGTVDYVTNAKTTGAYNFRTFCVQGATGVQYFTPNTTYRVDIATSTDHTSIAPLKAEVAYLFHLWNTGSMNLAGYAYDYDSTAAGRPESARSLQRAIWALQWGNVGLSNGDSTLTTGTMERAWYDQAIYDVGHGVWTGLGNVGVMRLYNVSGGADAQDQLVELTHPVPPTVPEPASLALLAVGALPVLPIIRRRRSPA